MDEDDTQHLADLMAHAALMGAVVLTVAVLMVAALVVTGCAVAIHVDAAPEPEQAKLDDTVELPADFIMPDGDFKDA